MGLRIRKSVKIAPGVRMNFGTKSGSVAIGGKGVYYNAKLYGGSKKKKSTPKGGGLGKLLYWLFIGWFIIIIGVKSGRHYSYYNLIF